MDKQTLCKAHQAKFNECYLGLQNTLGGNPLTLLRDDNSPELIYRAGTYLEQMLAIASLCHDKGAKEDGSVPNGPGVTDDGIAQTEPPALDKNANKPKASKDKKASEPKAEDEQNDNGSDEQ
ncbi:hypothetical protein [Vibrio sp. Sgm 5]|uniref:hypothetical protein n=1 Tax=Vibrio sp. Sgm 5 TaxID=2994387 RepID=UPI0022496BC5|nr:hypothetical protein [Vibrio sp. Sgm 5]MCX2788347.1 hypothetical protein [Vibrio sp. Sgm 5]